MSKTHQNHPENGKKHEHPEESKQEHHGKQGAKVDAKQEHHKEEGKAEHHTEHHKKTGRSAPRKKGHEVAPGSCFSVGCKAHAKRFNFCDQHYDHFKFGLITKAGDPVSDYEKKFEHYLAHKNKRGVQKVA